MATEYYGSTPQVERMDLPAIPFEKMMDNTSSNFNTLKYFGYLSINTDKFYRFGKDKATDKWFLDRGILTFFRYFAGFPLKDTPDPNPSLMELSENMAFLKDQFLITRYLPRTNYPKL